MRGFVYNLLVQFFLVNFIAIAVIGAVLAVVVTVGLNHEFNLLGDHDAAMHAGITINPGDSISIPSLKDDIATLRWLMIGILAAGLMGLYVVLVVMGRNVWRTLNQQNNQLIDQIQEIEETTRKLNNEIKERNEMERERSSVEESLGLNEIKYRTLVNQSPDMIFISRIDDFKITETNERACEFYGYSSEEFLSLDIFDLEMEPPLRQDVRALYDNTPVGQVVEVYGINKKKDGSTFPVHVRFSKLNETLAVANVRDISEQREIEKMKDGFISTVSHELRTPLTSIKGAAEILLNYDEEDRATQMEFLGIIDRESDRLTRLINDVLDLSRLESRQMNWDWSEVDLGEVVDEALNGMRALLEQRDLKVELGLDQDLPKVWNDRDRLLQVMTNLLGNAIKFTPNGGKVIIRARTLGADAAGKFAEKLEVCIADTGVGIQPSEHDIIFQKFVQAGNDLSERPRGTGLGLNICKEIVEYVGGEIWVDSTPGVGSSFYFTVPIKALDQAATPAR